MIWPEEKEEKMANKERKWDELSRFEKLSAVMYPQLVAKPLQKEIQEIANREGKRSPMQAREDQLKERTWAKR